jgi:hypothetical protein
MYREGRNCSPADAQPAFAGCSMLLRWPSRPATWSTGMEAFTPVALRDLYLTFSKDDRHVFLKLIASHCTGYEPLMMLDELPRAELWKYNSNVFGSLIQTALPILLKHARKLAKEHPSLTDEEFERQLETMVTQFVQNERDAVSELVREQIKKSRDRKSDPETIRRNVEICDLRKQNKKTWSQEKLAKKYEVTKQYISNVLKDEEKWRKFLSELPSDQSSK